jgi:putative endonuclease
LKREHRYFVYLLCSKPYGTIYAGVTGNLVGRTGEHRDEVRESFAKKYGIHRLVWFEEFQDAYDAIRREKRIKKWNRTWKIELIEKMNPTLEDLFFRIV